MILYYLYECYVYYVYYINYILYFTIKLLSSKGSPIH